jgi:hypothetical protein
MVTLETLSIAFTGLSISLAAFYYISTLRNANRMRELTLESQELTRKAQEQAVETREAQLFMQIYQQLNTIESQKTWAELLNMKWNNLEDFRVKFDSSVSVDSFGKRGHIWWTYTTIGHMLQKGLIDPDLVFKTLGSMVMMQWDKWKEVIYDTRERAVRQNAKGGLDMFKGFEYLNNEMVKILKEHPELKT